MEVGLPRPEDGDLSDAEAALSSAATVDNTVITHDRWKNLKAESAALKLSLPLIHMTDTDVVVLSKRGFISDLRDLQPANKRLREAVGLPPITLLVPTP